MAGRDLCRGYYDAKQPDAASDSDVLVISADGKGS